jgi:hypothetical protein
VTSLSLAYLGTRTSGEPASVLERSMLNAPAPVPAPVPAAPAAPPK